MIRVSERNFWTITIRRDSTSPANRETFSYVNFRVCLVLQGEAVWNINDRVFTVEQGDVIFLNSSQHRKFTSFGKDGFTMAVFCFDRSAFANLHHFLFLLNCVKEHHGVFKNLPLGNLLLEIYNETKSDHPLRYEMASALLTEFFIRLERQTNFVPDSDILMNGALLDILDYIDVHITEKLSLAELAKKAGLTESSFSRWFAKTNGISFKRYVMERRISLAVILLQTTNLKIIDIALECGFDSTSGFYDAFKKVTGTTPSHITNLNLI